METQKEVTISVPSLDDIHDAQYYLRMALHKLKFDGVIFEHLLTTLLEEAAGATLSPTENE